MHGYSGSGIMGGDVRGYPDIPPSVIIKPGHPPPPVILTRKGDRPPLKKCGRGNVRGGNNTEGGLSGVKITRKGDRPAIQKLWEGDRPGIQIWMGGGMSGRVIVRHS